MVSPNVILEYLHHAGAKGARSTALQPLIWALSIFAPSFTLSAYFQAPIGVTILLGVLLSLVTIAFLFAVVFFIWTGNIDPLRSERFTLQKMVIERNLVGDDKSGLREVSSASLDPLPAITPSAVLSHESGEGSEDVT